MLKLTKDKDGFSYNCYPISQPGIFGEMEKFMIRIADIVVVHADYTEHHQKCIADTELEYARTYNKRILYASRMNGL